MDKELSNKTIFLEIVEWRQMLSNGSDTERGWWEGTKEIYERQGN